MKNEKRERFSLIQLIHKIEATEYVLRDMKAQQPTDKEHIQLLENRMKFMVAELCHRTGKGLKEWQQFFAHPVFKPNEKYAAMFTRRYECEDYTCMGHPRGCLFCKHLSDVFWDYYSGPYMFICDLDGGDPHEGVFGRCKPFEEKEGD